jgi:hypothetical protein
LFAFKEAYVSDGNYGGVFFVTHTRMTEPDQTVSDSYTSDLSNLFTRPDRLKLIHVGPLTPVQKTRKFLTEKLVEPFLL